MAGNKNRNAYRQIFNNMFDMIEAAENKPVPKINDINTVPNDPNASWEYHTAQMRVAYRQKRLAVMLKEALKALPEEKKNEYFEKAIGPGADRNSVKSLWERILTKNQDPLQIMNNKEWGRTSYNQLLDALEAVLPEEKLIEIADTVQKLRAPGEPGYEGPDNVNPEKEAIEKLRQSEQGKANAELLDRVEDQLNIINPEIRDYINDYDDTVFGVSRLNQRNDWAASTISMAGFKSLNGGAFDGIFKPDKDPQRMESKNEGFSLSPENLGQRTRELTADEIETLKQIPAPISKETLEAADKFFDGMHGLDYSKTKGVMDPVKDKPFVIGQKPDDLIFSPEQGTKYYAFWPLVMARAELAKAVAGGNMEEIRAASENYQQIDDKIGAMYKAIDDHKLGDIKLFDGNVNSTRTATPFMPAKYVKDYVTHNKMNSLFNLNTAANNLGVDVKEFVRDPVNTQLKALDNYKKCNGIDSRGSIGAKLCWGMQVRDPEDNTGVHFVEFDRRWNSYMLFPVTRGLSGLIGIEPNHKKRAEYAALMNLGGLAATQEIEKEMARFEAVSEVASGEAEDSAEKMDLVYKNAALLPADQFSMEKIGDVFRDNENPQRWRKDLSIDELTKPENIKHLDFDELAGRSEAIVRDHDAERIKSNAYMNGVDTDEYLKSAFAVYSTVLQNADEQTRASDSFQRFAQSIQKLPALAKDENTRALLAAGAKTLVDPEYFNSLKTTKADRRTDSTDSEEYSDMQDSLQAVQDHIRVLREGPKNDAERKLLNGNFIDKLNAAKETAFRYAALRTKNGTKTKFSAESGQKRVNESLDAYIKIQQLEDAQGVSSPAQKMYDQARLALLTNRSNKQWMKENALEAVAKMVHAKRMIDAQIPEKNQQKAFDPKNWDAEFEKLKGRTEFKEYIKGVKYNLGKFADNAIADSEDFQRMTGSLSQSLKRHYTKSVAEPERSAQLRKDFLHRLALEEGARLAGCQLGQRACHPDNPKIQEEAAKLRQTEAFKETSKYLLRNMSEEDLEEYEPNVISGLNLYKTAGLKLKYEKMVSEICVNMIHGAELNLMEPEERQQQLDKRAAVLRKIPAFQAVMYEKQKDIYNPEKIEENIKNLQKPEERMKTGSEVFDAMNKKMQKQNAPEELLQGAHIGELQVEGQEQQLQRQSTDYKGLIVQG